VLLLGALSAAVALGLLATMGAFASGGAPTAETEHAAEITRHEAVLQAIVFPHGTETECQFEYGTSEGVLDKVVACPFKPGHRSIGVPESANLVGLTEDKTYYFRIHASNIHGEEGNGGERAFTTLPHKPNANTESAREVKRSSATLTGFVTPNGSALTECYFEWGPEKEAPLTEIANCAQTVGAGPEPSEEVQVTAHITGLDESHLYYYRVVAKNAYGEDVGGKAHFESLPAAPHANTEPARFVERTSATLKGFVTPNDAKVEECYFLWAVQGKPLTNRANCETFGAGSGEVREAVDAQITGLQEGTKYSFQLVATNEKGTDEGGVAGFETQPKGPKVLMHHARNVTATSAELSASVNPEGAPTECYFEYGTTPALGGVAPCETSPGEGEEYVKVGAKVSGLTPNTTYLVRLEAFNEKGSARGGEGEKKNFTTAKGGQAPTVTKLSPKKGLAAGGTEVKILGSNFEEVTAVYFGFTEAEEIKEVNAGNANNLGRIVAIAPPGLGKVDVTVVTANGTSPINPKDAYQYGKPTITSVSPDEGPATGGTEVTITGSGFELGAHGTEFEFASSKATAVECTSSTTCAVIVPPKSGNPKKTVVNVQATVNNVKSRKVKFKYTT